MNALAKILTTDREVKLVATTVGRDLLPSELDLFIHMCRSLRLDPLRKQIYANVFKRKKKDQNGNWIESRQVVYVTGIDGYRTLADRTGTYRPGDRTVELDKESRNPETNPQGIISATATAWKYVQGEWHSFSETVYWEEYAPLKEVWENKKPTGKLQLDTSGQWGKMGIVMLKKCAEAQLLRRGWPDEYGDLYVAEEMDQAKIIDITPHEQAQRAAELEREHKLGGPSIIIDWMDGDALQAVPVDQVHGRVRDYIKRNADEPMTIVAFGDRNREALRQYWKAKPDEALDLKKAFEIYAKTALTGAA